ncbi:hypothetical protein [Actinoplanes sp. NPDC051851]|uniref:hypothetical protein n=1 Tax=Actinoplanes sp. NPDC051851 TaxID=3154753 RepID=UPI0034402A17
MNGPDLVLVLRYRKAATYGFHALLGALGEHETATRYEVRCRRQRGRDRPAHPGGRGREGARPVSPAWPIGMPPAT